MTKKQSVFLKPSSSIKSRLIQFCLALVTVFLCVVISPFAQTSSSAIASLPSISAQAQNLVQQGKTLYDAGQFAQAVELLQQVAEDFKANRDELSQAMALSNLSLAFEQLGQWDKAENAIAQSLKLLQSKQNINSSLERSQILAQSLDIQGKLQLARGQAEAALTTWQQAANIYAQIDDDAGVTRNRINQAQAMQALGLYRQAQKTLTQANQTLQKQPDSALKATGLRSLGNVFRVVGNLPASRQVLEQSLTVAKQSASPQDFADTLLSLGNTARAQQKTPEAINFYQLSASTSSSPTTRIEAQLNQLSLLVDNQQWHEAESLYAQIQPQLANLPPSRTGVYAQINLAQSLTQLKQYSVSNTPSWQDISQLLATSVRQARDLKDGRATSYALGNLAKLYEQTRQWEDATNLTQQALFAAQVIDAADVAYLWQWQLGRLLKQQGKTTEAIAAYTQSVNNLRSLRSDLVAINPDVQFNFRDEVEPVYRQLVDLLLQPDNNSPTSSNNLQIARTAIESLQLAELENFFRSACLDAKPQLIDRVVDREDPTAAVIYPIILPDRLEVILKLPEQANLRHYVTKKPQSEVENILETLQKYLKEPDRTYDVKKLSQQIYSWLIQLLEAELGKTQVKKLVFVLDGALRNIPMAVFYDEKQQKYLIEKYAIALTPGLQLLAPQHLQRQRLNALTAGVSESREVEGRQFPRLDNVKLELNQIDSQLPRSKALLDRKFTETNLQSQIKSASFNVVHMATHGQFSSNLDDTFILTWDRLLKINDLDNLLRANNPQGTSNIELLVLSACETATGDNRATLGLAGIAARAGARSILATLWSVDDRSTAALMSEFYKQLANTNLTKAEALQQAQLALWNNKNQDWKRPYFWAAYVLVGNWL